VCIPGKVGCLDPFGPPTITPGCFCVPTDVAAAPCECGPQGTACAPGLVCQLSGTCFNNQCLAQECVGP
jgi:hypothetical protein